MSWYFTLNCLLWLVLKMKLYTYYFFCTFWKNKVILLLKNFLLHNWSQWKHPLKSDWRRQWLFKQWQINISWSLFVNPNALFSTIEVTCVRDSRRPIPLAFQSGLTQNINIFQLITADHTSQMLSLLQPQVVVTWAK